jgi:hypothetical protein
LTHEISLAEAIPTAARLMDGKVRGRVVVDVTCKIAKIKNVARVRPGNLR